MCHVENGTWDADGRRPPHSDDTTRSVTHGAHSTAYCIGSIGRSPRAAHDITNTAPKLRASVCAISQNDDDGGDDDGWGFWAAKWRFGDVQARMRVSAAVPDMIASLPRDACPATTNDQSHSLRVHSRAHMRDATYSASLRDACAYVRLLQRNTRGARAPL